MATVTIRGPLPKVIELPEGGGGGGPAYDDEDEVGVGEIGVAFLTNAGSVDEEVISEPLAHSDAGMTLRRYHLTVTVTNAGLCRLGFENVIGLPMLHVTSVEKSAVPLVPVTSFAKLGFFDGDGYEIHFVAEAGATYAINGTFGTGPAA